LKLANRKVEQIGCRNTCMVRKLKSIIPLT
jgi:hypothetical protein